MSDKDLSQLLLSCNGIKYVYPEIYRGCIETDSGNHAVCVLSEDCQCAAKLKQEWEKVKFSHPIYTRRLELNSWCDYLIDNGFAAPDDLVGLMTRDHAAKREAKK